MSLSLLSLVLIALLLPLPVVFGFWYSGRRVIVRRFTFIGGGLMLMYLLMAIALFMSISNIGMTGTPLPPPKSFGESVEDQFLLRILKATVVGFLGLLVLRRLCAGRRAAQ